MSIHHDQSPHRLDAELQRMRTLALFPGSERDLLYEQHPVVKDEFIVATQPIQQAYDIVVKCIVHRQPGTCLIGEFRVGKTSAIKLIKYELMQTFPNLPIGNIIAKGHDPYTEKTFFTDILSDYQHGGACTGTTMERRNRLRTLIEFEARHHNSDKYLLMVDEGQNWNEMQWNLLRDLTNDLQMVNVSVLTVTFGHPELLTVRGKLMRRQRTDLIGRFLLKPYQFKGLSSATELEEALNAYDNSDQYQYPANSNISYAEFLMPKAWGSGWRMANEANLLWSALTHVAKRLNHQPSQVGMNWVGGAIRNFLFASSDEDCVGFRGTLDDWVSAVEASDYESSII